MKDKNYPILLAIAAVLLIAIGISYSTAFIVDGPGSPGGEFEFNLTDSVPPTWSEQSQSKDSADVGDTIIFTVFLKDETALQSASLNISGGEEWTVAETQNLVGKDALVTFRYVVGDFIPGTRVNWNVVFRDKGDNKVITDTMNFIVSDTVPPEIFEQEQESDEVVKGSSILLSVRVSDNHIVSSVSFETNETGRYEEVRKYNFSERDVVASMYWTNKSVVKEDMRIFWKVTAEDSWGNVKVSDEISFKVKGCPACASDSKWSNCDRTESGEWKQTQIYYLCGANTNFTCSLNTREQGCVPGVMREEAESTIDDAIAAIDIAKDENKDVKRAEELLMKAQEAYDSGDWTEARGKALEAKVYADTAGPIEHPGPNYLPFLVLIIVIIGGVWMLLRFGKIHLPLAETFTPPSEAKPAKSKLAQLCGVCGKRFSKLYTCALCKTKVCFDDARTWQGKIYCVNDLRKKGLI